jgi:replication-associated recombination protein RarA
MKQSKLAMTQNVEKSVVMLNYLLKRPKLEMVGLGLIYGAPGLGKSRFARRFAIQNDFMYMRLESTSTAKTFLVDFYNLLARRYNVGARPRGNANKILSMCIEILHDAKDPVIFIDEIDYAFTYQNKALLGAIRDIVDETLSVIVLVGMQDAKKSLLRANAHYFDRCNYFVEYKKLNTKDITNIFNEISDVEVTAPAIARISKATDGTLRKVIKILHAVEKIAASKGLTKIEEKDIRGIV